MKIPSYDDLTPSIPDVHPRDTFDQVTRLVRAAEAPVAQGDVRPTADAGVFACLRTARESAAAFAVARDFSPRIERHGATSVVLDVGGLGRLLGDAHGIAAELKRTVDERGLKAWITIAPTHTAARLLALAGRDVVVTGDAAVALATVPLAVLEQIGTDGALLSVLRRWGLRTLGELAVLPSGELAARFGQHGVAVQRLARGIDPRPLVPDPGVPRFVASMELEWPVDALEPLSFVFARLLDPLSLALEAADKGAAAIRLDLRLTDRTAHVRSLQLPAAMRDARVLRTLLLLDLESHPPAAGVDAVTIEIDPAPARIVQFSLLERATPSHETVATLTARLSALVGESRCGSPVLLDSHRPDAFAMQRFQAEPTRAAELPAPGGEAIVLRRLRPPVVIRVTVDQGRPVYIPVDRKGMPGGRIERSAGPWRSSGEWWDADGTRWDRDEWDIELADGSVCRVYHDRRTSRWFMDAVVD